MAKLFQSFNIPSLTSAFSVSSTFWPFMSLWMTLCAWRWERPWTQTKKSKWCVKVTSSVDCGCTNQIQSLTLRISLQMYAIQSSFRELPLVFLTRSVTDPAPQNSITSYMHMKNLMSTINALYRFKTINRYGMRVDRPKAGHHVLVDSSWQRHHSTWLCCGDGCIFSACWFLLWSPPLPPL